MSEGVRCMRSANIISLYFIASQCVMDRYCSYSATGYPRNMCFVHKNGPFRGYNPGNCNAVHIFPAYCGWGREKETGADEKGDNCAEEAFL